MGTEDNFRLLLGRTATDRTIKLAAAAIDTLEAAGAPKEVVNLVIDAIEAWHAQQYEFREGTVEQIRDDSGLSPKKPGRR
jgi:hypothetical protein